MHFYERHLGDYARDTGHLSLLEHGVYGVLLDRYYSTEEPIPAAQAYRIARARTDDERAAVDAVLAEFFVLDGDLWRSPRCDEEIARFRERVETNRANGRKGGRPRKNPAGSAGESETEPNGNRSVSSGFGLGSSGETETKGPQPPVPSPQSAVSSSQHAARAPADAGGAMTEAGRACRLMREAGCATTNPSHPDLLAALGEGCTPEELAATVTEAIAGGIRRPFPWAISTARGRRADGPRPMTTGATHAHPDTRAAAGGGPRLSLADRAAQRAQDILARRAERDRAAG